MRVIHRKGHVRRSLTGGYVWVRPSEKVKLKNFRYEHIHTIKPTLKALDSGTQKHVQFRSSVYLTGSQKVSREYRRHYGGRKSIQVGGLTYPTRLGRGKNKILLNDATFKRKAYFNPGGVLTHEFAHSAQLEQSRRIQNQWSKVAKIQHNTHKARQNVDHHEDFAESFRHQLGQPITRKNDKAFKVAVDQSRREHLYKHYLR